MPNKTDITHTVALKNRPHPDARLIRDLDTGEAEWDIPQDVSEPEMITVPVEDVAPSIVEEMQEEKVTHEHKPKPKKLHHG